MRFNQFLYGIVFILLFIQSCKREKDFQKTHNKDNNFYLKLEIPETITLNQKYILTYKDKNNQITIDTFKTQNNKTFIQGQVKYPLQATIVDLYNQKDYFPFILYADTLTILIKQPIEKSLLINSSLNEEWKKLVDSSAIFFKQIGFLYPKIQKARLNNNQHLLKIYSEEIDIIKANQKQYLINYIEQNPKSQLVPLILNNLYFSFPNDSLLFINKANQFSSKQKEALSF